MSGDLSNDIEDQIREAARRRALDPETPRADAIAKQQQRFRARFGPEQLRALDGEALLLEMHGRAAKDSLAYWLEYKGDEAFKTTWFGRIGGGSAFKFGLYQAADTGQWISGGTRAPEILTLEGAAALARRQRDELVAGAEVLRRFDPAVGDYGELQAQMEAAAPNLADTSWGHKYWSLLFPEALPPIHGNDYRAHQLIKLGRPPGGGRYRDDGELAAVSRQVGLGLYELGRVLHGLHGSPHGYWRLGTTPGEDPDKSVWEKMRVQGYASIGYRLGDLSDLDAGPEGKAQLRAALAPTTANGGGKLTKVVNQILDFRHTMMAGDVIVAMQGLEVLGVGVIRGDYGFAADPDGSPHRRPVEWRNVERWQLPEQEGLRTTVCRLKRPANLIAIELRLAGRALGVSGSAAPPSGPPALPPVVAQIEGILERKRQVILYGPPGTGKTWWAHQAAWELAARAWFGVAAEALSRSQRETLQRAIEMCAFHPGYGYEDFLEGFRPIVRDGGALGYEVRPGLFKRACERARDDGRRRPYFLVIDEINRGDLPRIFGELLTVLERDKRGLPITLPLSHDVLVVPDNLLLIGTMNTADRSIALLDAALRRRFGFIELLPEPAQLEGAAVGQLPVSAWLAQLNGRIRERADGRNLQVGHAYFMSGSKPLRDPARFVQVLRHDVIPLLEEYCYGDYRALAKLLGDEVVDTKAQRVRDELFEPERLVELVGALLAAYPDITALPGVAASVDMEQPVEADEMDADDDDAEEG